MLQAKVDPSQVQEWLDEGEEGQEGGYAKGAPANRSNHQQGQGHGGESEGRQPCTFFALGTCTRGSACRFSHALDAPRPTCKFFVSPQVRPGHAYILNPIPWTLDPKS